MPWNKSRLTGLARGTLAALALVLASASAFAADKKAAAPALPEVPAALTPAEADAFLAAVLLFFGIIYSAFGYTLFRLAVTLNVAALGIWAGFFAGKQFDARLPGMVIGGVLFAALAWPAMRLAVAVCGGLVGFVIGVAVWRSLDLADNYAVAGGLIGAIFLFMLSFSLFKLSILAFTAIQGAVMIIAGVLGLLLKYPPVDERITTWTSQQPAILPIALLALSLIALIFQQQWHRQAASESD